MDSDVKKEDITIVLRSMGLVAEIIQICWTKVQSLHFIKSWDNTLYMNVAQHICTLHWPRLCAYLTELSQLLTLLIHSGLLQHVIHHLHQQDHFQSATGLPGNTA